VRFGEVFRYEFGYRMRSASTWGYAVFLFLIMVYSIPPDPKSLSLDAFMNDQRFAKFMIKQGGGARMRSRRDGAG